MFAPIFDEMYYFSEHICFFDSRNRTPYAKVRYKNEPYLLDEDGNMRKYKCKFDKLVLYEETKINIRELEK